MKKIFVGTLTVSLMLLFACSGTKQVTQMQQSGETAFQQGDYQTALNDLEQVIGHYEKTDNQKECPVYAKAAYCAMKLGHNDMAEDLYTKNTYTDFVTGDTYYELAKLYRSRDNLSREMDALETYLKNYPGGVKTDSVNSRLFVLYTESQNWQQAEEMWPKLNAQAAFNQKLFEDYFKVNKALDNDSVCNLVAGNLLNMNKENKTALNWFAVNYFWRAENLYQSELKAYNKNKTNKQYKHLLKSLDVVTADFKKSLDYFKQLYKLDPQPEYAQYLGNIYTRLDDKKKAEYYYKLSK